jgi:hypothetical protein
MKVHLYGNILNNGYNLTRFLRAAGYDAVFFLDDSSNASQDYPWWEDANLRPDNLPEWIRYYRFAPKWLTPGREERRLFADFGQADIALVCGWGPVLAAKARIPFVFYSYGEDLNIADTRFGVTKILRMMLRGHLPRGLRKYLTIGLLQRRHLKTAEFVAVAMTYQMTHIRTLGLMPKMAQFRLAWDTSRYAARRDLHFESEYSGFDRVFFMIARHSWHSLSRDFKGNDKFLRAFAHYVHMRKPNVRLVLIEKGHDVGRSRKLIEQLKIAPYVQWVREMDKTGIRAFLSLPNAVVVDQFWHDRWYELYRNDSRNPAVIQYLASDREHPSPILKNKGLSLIGFGSGSIEALSAGRPLITAFFEHEFYDGEDPPIFAAFSETEIFEALLKVDAMSDGELAEMGIQGKKFVEHFHAWKNVIPLYTSLLERASARRTVGASAIDSPAHA